MPPGSSFNLQQHLQQEHHLSPFSEYLREIVYGGNDGIVTTFAVVAGFSGAQVGSNTATYSFVTVLLFGLANLFADATSMGLGNFLSIRAQKQVYLREKHKEATEIRNKPYNEQAETENILKQKGFTTKQAQILTEIYATNPRYWTEWMMHHELELASPENTSPARTALATFLAFLSFGIIPLIPFFLLSTDPTQTFFYSIFATATALVLLGLLKGKVTQSSLAQSVGEMVLIGGASAVIAFVVGCLFRDYV